jgi:polyphosphate glucokinase
VKKSIHSELNMEALGIDIGGTGIKGAVIDTRTGQLVTPRQRLLTPVPSDPTHVSQTVSEIVRALGWSGIAGAGFPSVVRSGVVYTAANVDPEWIGTDCNALLSKTTNCKFFVTNDADAAGMAEMKFGAGMDYKKGVAMMITLGTGIGSAVFTDGVLVPNLELGHLIIRGKDAERRASDATRQRKNLSWEEWAIRVEEYFQYLEAIFWPDVFIIGGGGSKYFDKFSPFVHLRTRMIPARFLNEAGIVGAALFAEQKSLSSTSFAENTPLS